jgi:hypothetical protein
MSLYT